MNFKGVFLLGLISICTGTSVQVPVDQVKVGEPVLQLAPLDGENDAATVPIQGAAAEPSPPSGHQGVSGLDSPIGLDVNGPALPLPQDVPVPSEGMTGMAEPLAVSAEKPPPQPLPLPHAALGVGADQEVLQNVPPAPVPPPKGLKLSIIHPRPPAPPQILPVPPLGNDNPVDEQNFIKLYVKDRATGVYRTEKGEYVRLFKILSPPTDLASVALPAVPVPKPMPMPMPVPRLPIQQRSLPMMTPNIMGRATGMGGPTGRYNTFDYGFSDPYYNYYNMYDPYSFNGYGSIGSNGYYLNGYNFPGYQPYYGI